jgi:signal transduction histidine kinase
VISGLEADTSGVVADAGHVLAWAVREGVANVLRHSSASWYSISIRHDDRNVTLQIRNGVLGAPVGCFELTVEIPLEAP